MYTHANRNAYIHRLRKLHRHVNQYINNIVLIPCGTMCRRELGPLITHTDKYIFLDACAHTHTLTFLLYCCWNEREESNYRSTSTSATTSPPAAPPTPPTPTTKKQQKQQHRTTRSTATAATTTTNDTFCPGLEDLLVQAGCELKLEISLGFGS